MHEHEAGTGLLMAPIDTLERDIEEIFDVICLTESGLGFGDGAISTAARIEKQEVSRADLEIGKELITSDPDLFTVVDADAADDGCGDGRQAAMVFRMNEDGQLEVFNKSRRRAKVFGGGLVVASSMWRSVAGSIHHGETVYGDRQFIADQLEQKGITYGAHTDTHAQGDNCGCGAIDKYPQITANALRDKSSIEATLQVLYGDDYDDNRDAIESVFATYHELIGDEKYFSNASGKQTMDFIRGDGAVIKQLSDDHLEAFIVLNDVDGTTFDQRKFDKKLQARGVTSEPQVFVVDSWRGRMYAEMTAQIAVETLTDVDYEAVRKVAYADFLIRTLAVASTLTAGDLPVFARS